MNSVYPTALPPGSRIESYEISSVLGVGGFGITYKGYDHSLHCDVAIKEYLPHTLALRTADGTTVTPRSEHDRKYYAYGLQRFLEKARVLAKFKERSIVRLSRFLEANGTGYLIMDYEEGESLAERLRRVGVLEEAELCAPPYRSWKACAPCTPRISCTATSSRATSSSAATVRRCCSTSARHARRSASRRVPSLAW